MTPKPCPSSPSPLPQIPSPTFDDTGEDHPHSQPSLSSSSSSSSSSCPFCHIAHTYPPYDPRNPPPRTSPLLDPARTSPSPSTFLVLSTPRLVGFLDIMPLSRGHVLLCPRRHRPRLTDTSPDEAAELGRYLRVLSAAVLRAVDDDGGDGGRVRDWNVVQNNGAAAAQVVPHAHFHVVPRPPGHSGYYGAGGGGGAGRFAAAATMFGRSQREELDDDEAGELAERVRRAVAEVLRADGEGPVGCKL